MDSNRHEKRLLFIILAFIFAIGFLIRVYQLGSIPPGLYTDELVGILSAKIQLSGVHSVPFANISPRTLPATLHDFISGYFLSILIFGLGTFAARFPWRKCEEYNAPTIEVVSLARTGVPEAIDSTVGL